MIYYPGKPKIVKPTEKPEEPDVEEEQIKGIRGRRKPLYSKSNVNNKIASKSIKPARTVMSNLVKNVTSTLKSNNPLKSTTPKKQLTKPTPTKPVVTQSRVSSGYGSRPLSQGSRMPAGKSINKQAPPSTRPTSLPPKGTSTKFSPLQLLLLLFSIRRNSSHGTPRHIHKRQYSSFE